MIHEPPRVSWTPRGQATDLNAAAVTRAVAGSSSGPDAWRDRFDPLLSSTALTAVDLAEHSARHRAVQVYFSTTVRPGTRMEVPIPGSGTNGGTGFAGRGGARLAPTATARLRSSVLPRSPPPDVAPSDRQRGA